jgi:hypothetical protein
MTNKKRLTKPADGSEQGCPQQSRSGHDEHQRYRSEENKQPKKCRMGVWGATSRFQEFGYRMALSPKDWRPVCCLDTYEGYKPDPLAQRHGSESSAQAARRYSWSRPPNTSTRSTGDPPLRPDPRPDRLPLPQLARPSGAGNLPPSRSPARTTGSRLQQRTSRPGEPGGGRSLRTPPRDLATDNVPLF